MNLQNSGCNNEDKKLYNLTYAELLFLHVAYSKLTAALVVSIHFRTACAVYMRMGLKLSPAGIFRSVFVLKRQFLINDILLQCFRIVGNYVITQRTFPKTL